MEGFEAFDVRVKRLDCYVSKEAERSRKRLSVFFRMIAAKELCLFSAQTGATVRDSVFTWNSDEESPS
jgi:hypothetical protein